MKSKPIVGVTGFWKDSGRGYGFHALNEAYVRVLQEAGALPVLIPLGLPNSDLDQLQGKLDAIVFTGGGDLDPAAFNGQRHPSIYNINPERDRIELYLAGKVVSEGQPFLGICRGLQVLNVALGGDLYTHIPDQLPGAIEHRCSPDHPRDYTKHPVRIEEGTRLAAYIDKPIIQVNSQHHQGVKRLAAGLQATAFSSDGLVEAVESPDHPFGIAVQWHPEWLPGEDSTRALFKAFVNAAVNGHA